MKLKSPYATLLFFTLIANCTSTISKKDRRIIENANHLEIYDKNYGELTIQKIKNTDNSGVNVLEIVLDAFIIPAPGERLFIASQQNKWIEETADYLHVKLPSASKYQLNRFQNADLFQKKDPFDQNGETENLALFFETYPELRFLPVIIRSDYKKWNFKYTVKIALQTERTHRLLWKTKCEYKSAQSNDLPTYFHDHGAYTLQLYDKAAQFCAAELQKRFDSAMQNPAENPELPSE